MFGLFFGYKIKKIFYIGKKFLKLKNLQIGFLGKSGKKAG